MAALSVHSPGRGTTSGTPSDRGARGDPLAQHRVGRDAAAEDDRARADPLRGAQRLGREHVDDRLLERVGQLGDGRRRQRRAVGPGTDLIGGDAQLVRDGAPRRRLEAAEAEVERLAQPGAREAALVRAGGRGGLLDGRATRVRQAEQPPDLVERLAGRVVDGLAEQPVVQVVRSSRPGTCGRR